MRWLAWTRTINVYHLTDTFIIYYHSWTSKATVLYKSCHVTHNISFDSSQINYYTHAQNIELNDPWIHCRFNAIRSQKLFHKSLDTFFHIKKRTNRQNAKIELCVMCLQRKPQHNPDPTYFVKPLQATIQTTIETASSSIINYGHWAGRNSGIT